MAHDHSGAGAPRTDRTRLAIAFGVTALIVLAQAVGSVVTGSLALLTDTAHALADASGLLVALIAASLMLRPASNRRTWGFARIEVIAALGQATLLLVVGLYTAVEGIGRLTAPPQVPATELLVFGIVGLIANLIAIIVLAGGRGTNLNMRAAFLEVLNDALGSVGVIVAAVVIATTGFYRADAFAGLFIAALIVPRAVRILRETLRILMEFTPPGVDLDAVREHLLGLEHVREVHDLHASTIGTGLPILTAHVVLDDACFESGHAPEILAEIRSCVTGHFAVSFDHATIQLETATVRDQERAGAVHS
ncbi:MAG TPA: cation diffusion facilitator family transporter [Candidatus Ruania gallistercoris]|uniref:Cation diffusion facilitator family transporter n=1 Tax=Candidatus Ruania gallistercoris TaxID=2838746 RepID=A0A9D2ED38_9MICO|nr:cation diffusion facilitator family transporter [Candidatus Ruania gallistercoris]